MDVGRETVGRLVPACPVLLQTLHHDPVEIPLQQRTQLLEIHTALLSGAGAGIAQ